MELVMKDDIGVIHCWKYLKKVLKREIVYITYGENVMIQNSHTPIYLYW